MRSIPLDDPSPDDCATVECVGGMPRLVGGANGACGADPAPSDCVVPFCDVSTMPAECISGPAPVGTPCKQGAGASGTCDVLGNCV